MTSKQPQSELVLIHVVTVNYLPLLYDAYNQFGHLIFSSVSLTPYCIHLWLGHLGSGYHTDALAHPKPMSNIKKFNFLQTSLFVWVAKLPFRGSRVSTCVRGCVCA